MKVIAINGSPRLNGNTRESLEIVGEVLNENGIEFEIVDLVKLNLKPCNGCAQCMGKGKCVQKDDINDLLKRLLNVDGIILGSPTYFSNLTSRMAMFIERIGIISKLNGNLLKGKVGASVAVARRMGACEVYSAMLYFFGISEMPVTSSKYWNVIVALNPGDVKSDAEGIDILKTLGKNMSNMLKKLCG
ncbi:MAG: flavodoxin family protein [Promethearchaeota archaeon]